MNPDGSLLAAAQEAADIAHQLILERTLGHVRAKDDRDFVSEVDLAVERAVRNLLRARTPDIGFLGEEEGWHEATTSRQRWWVLDPVDGTTNLVKAIPLCAVSLALIEGDRATVGVVDAPFLGLRYTAMAGQGAYLGEERLQVSNIPRIEDAVVAFGDYAVGAGAQQKNRLRLAVTAELAATVQRVRMFGSAAIDLVWLAEGKLDAAVMLSNKPWDTAAGVLIAREAGAEVVDATGADHTVRSTETIAAPRPLIDPVLTLLQKANGLQSPA